MKNDLGLFPGGGGNKDVIAGDRYASQDPIYSVCSLGCYPMPLLFVAHGSTPPRVHGRRIWAFLWFYRPANDFSLCRYRHYAQQDMDA